MNIKIDVQKREEFLKTQIDNYNRLCTCGTGPDIKSIFVKIFNEGFKHFHSQYIDAQEQEELEEHMLRHPEYYDEEFDLNKLDSHDKF